MTAYISTFFKTIRAAEKYLNTLPRWLQKRKEVLKIKGGYLVVGKSEMR